LPILPVHRAIALGASARPGISNAGEGGNGLLEGAKSRFLPLRRLTWSGPADRYGPLFRQAVSIARRYGAQSLDE
jgi:hypothetical protein